MLLNKAELYRIKEKTLFDENEMKWIVPYFYLRGKEVVLPKINAKDTVAKELQEREVVIDTAAGGSDSDQQLSPDSQGEQNVSQYSNGGASNVYK
jgi:DNA-directed RNA polymerase subunit H (RpoH/RPB5)